MSFYSRRQFLQTSVIGTGLVGSGLLGSGLVFGKPPIPGVETRVPNTTTGVERTSQPALWVLEVYFKPVRMIVTDVPDPKTGKTSRQLLWYLCYRVVNRLDHEVAADAPLPKDPPLFVPEILLVTDTGKSYYDNVIPLAQAAVNKRERFPYENSAQIMKPIPRPCGPSVQDPPSLYGVATWRNVDPKTDRFTLYMSGFSNGYQMGKTQEGQDIVLRKTLVVHFDRPSDEFEQSEEEIMPSDDREKEPKWAYLPTRDSAKKAKGS